MALRDVLEIRSIGFAANDLELGILEIGKN